MRRREREDRSLVPAKVEESRGRGKRRSGQQRHRDQRALPLVAVGQRCRERSRQGGRKHADEAENSDRRSPATLVGKDAECHDERPFARDRHAVGKLEPAEVPVACNRCELSEHPAARGHCEARMQLGTGGEQRFALAHVPRRPNRPCRTRARWAKLLVGLRASSVCNQLLRGAQAVERVVRRTPHSARSPPPPGSRAPARRPSRAATARRRTRARPARSAPARGRASRRPRRATADRSPRSRTGATPATLPGPLRAFRPRAVRCWSTGR